VNSRRTESERGRMIAAPVAGDQSWGRKKYWLSDCMMSFNPLQRRYPYYDPISTLPEAAKPGGTPSPALDHVVT
jgi:hypothetical protein